MTQNLARQMQPLDRVFFLPENFLSSGPVRLFDVFREGGQSISAAIARALQLEPKDGLVLVPRAAGGAEASALTKQLSQTLFNDDAQLTCVELQTHDLVFAPAQERAGQRHEGFVIDVHTTSYARSGYLVQLVLLWDGKSGQVFRHRLPRAVQTPAIGQSLSISYGEKGRPYVTGLPSVVPKAA